MSRVYNTFEFIGNVFIPNNKDKFHEVNEFDSGWVGHRLNFAVQESKTNSVYVEMYGGYSKSKVNVVKTFGKGTESNKGEKLEIPWDVRLDDETIDMVADFKKYIIDLTIDSKVRERVNQITYEIRSIEYKDTKTDEDNEKLKQLKSELKEIAPNRKEFIHSYDAIQFLSESLEEYKDYKFKLTGQIEYSESKGNFYRKFKPDTIEIVDNEEPSKLRATTDVFFTKESLDESDFKEEKKLYINGYVLSYDGKHKKDMFFPQQFIINASKLDFNDELHVGRLKFLRGTFDVKGKGVYHVPWEVNVFRGADKVEFTINDLTQKQREMVEFGFNKLEDFAPKGGMLGETLYENRLVKPILKKFDNVNDFTEGAVESDYSDEDLTYVPFVQEQKQPSKQETKQEEPKTEIKNDINLDDLFA